MNFRLVACLLCFSALAADWDRKPFPNWSDQDVLRLLTNSPWCRPRSVDIQWHKRDRTQLDVRDIPGTSGPNAMSNRSMSPIGGIGVPKSNLPPSADLLIRWASALPIRQAVALYKARDARSDDAAALNRLVGVAGPDYVLEIHGLPAEVAHLGASTLELAATRAVTVRTASGRTLRPARSEARLDGLNVTLFLHFPRSAEITLADRELDVEADFEIFRFKERFSLRSMRYLGHLDI